MGAFLKRNDSGIFIIFKGIQIEGWLRVVKRGRRKRKEGRVQAFATEQQRETSLPSLSPASDRFPPSKSVAFQSPHQMP